jgi:hypothetical protein
MMRTQPPGFRWLVGGFALVAAVAFGFHYRSSGDRAELLLGALCLAVAGYWLIFDREPPSDDVGEDGWQAAERGGDDCGTEWGHGEEAPRGHGWDDGW